MVGGAGGGITITAVCKTLPWGVLLKNTHSLFRQVCLSTGMCLASDL